MACSPEQKASYKAAGFTDAEITTICGADEERLPPETVTGSHLYNSDGTYAGQLVPTSSVKQAPKAYQDAPFLLRRADGSYVRFVGGAYMNEFGQGFTLDDQGRIASSRNLPLDGDGGGGGGGGATGARAPDPASSINALFDYYDRQVAAGQMPRQQAIEEFNRQMQIIEAQQAQEMAVREREIARSTRGLGIQQERGARATSLARDILPFSLPGNISTLNLPLIQGGIPLNQINPDQFFDIAGLNAIPDIGAQTTAPFDPNALPQLPTYTPPPLPDISALIGQLQSGFGGFVA